MIQHARRPGRGGLRRSHANFSRLVEEPAGYAMLCMSARAVDCKPSTRRRLLKPGLKRLLQAVTVRFLTRRFISEYSSMKDLLYRHTVLVDNRVLELEILDTSRYQENKFPEDKMGWADALVVVYSIEDRWSFEEASLCLQKIQQLCPCLPTILVANKRDLSHVRQVDVDDGRQLSLQIHCQFFEVSAADSYAGVSVAFQSILREVLATKILRSLTPVRRRLTVVAVSKLVGAVFGKNGKRHKKRPSLSL
ncbi:hypothetical protein HPB50_017343 [Hyalomma asiaticum]|uniref:Uncharacterized protein n=1 Tax=Hyalomma asiaticum TaxID=266040 RepID=A0ACB7RQF5_HYAAI|nr:hypothetical protein HPB50_017343 [Hyalomma asiaticum]